MRGGVGLGKMQSKGPRQPAASLDRTHRAPNREFVTFTAPERRGTAGRVLLLAAPSLAMQRGCLVVLLQPKGVPWMRCDSAMCARSHDQSAVGSCEDGWLEEGRSRSKIRLPTG
jgi:hypothetical protein